MPAALTTATKQATDRRSVFFADLAKQKNQIAIALPRGLNAERFARIVWTTWQRTPVIQQCTNSSVLAAVMQAAQLGLEPDGTLGLAYLVPYGNQCQLVIGYKGLIELARRSGLVASISAEVVKPGDYFHYELGLTPTLKHIPAEVLGLEAREVQERAEALAALANERKEKIVAAYAVVRFKDGTHHFKVVTGDYVKKVRAASKSSGNAASPWNQWEEQMWAKTAIKVTLKHVPLSPEDRSMLDAALGVDERVFVKLGDTGQIVAADDSGAPIETPTEPVTDAAAAPTALDALVADQDDGDDAEAAEPAKTRGKRGRKSGENEAQGKLVE